MRLLRRPIPARTPVIATLENATHVPPQGPAGSEQNAAHYVAELSGAKCLQRINLASELEAALKDRRWLAASG